MSDPVSPYDIDWYAFVPNLGSLEAMVQLLADIGSEANRDAVLATVPEGKLSILYELIDAADVKHPELGQYLRRVLATRVEAPGGHYRIGGLPLSYAPPPD